MRKRTPSCSKCSALMAVLKRIMSQPGITINEKHPLAIAARSAIAKAERS